MRVQVAERPPGNGLNTRTSMLACSLQVHETPVLARGVEIVHQHAHAHAAIGGGAHMLQQDSRGLVLMDDVVLDIEGSLGMIGERDQAIEGVLAGEQQPDSG